MIRSGLLFLAAAALLNAAGASFTQDFPPEEFRQRRLKIYEAIGSNAIAIIPGAPQPDGFVRFRQSNEFYYLCGLETPHAYLFLDGATKRATLYLPHANPRRDAIDGKRWSAEDADELSKLSGIDEVQPIEFMAERIARSVWGTAERAAFVPLQPAEGMSVSRDGAWKAAVERYTDPWDGGIGREARFAMLLKERYPTIEIRNLSPILDNLRSIKSPLEISMIERSTRAAGEALMEAMRSSTPGMKEMELETLADLVFALHGAQGRAYHAIVASGPNAWFPHYSANSRRMDGGELVLMDYAPDIGYYMADVTRQWPVDGKFTPEQKQLYLFYLGVYEAVLSSLKPGVPIEDLRKDWSAKIDQVLAQSTFPKPDHEKAAKAFASQVKMMPPMALGHHIGLSTHDVGPRISGELKPGMVFCFEPQFRVPEEKIYIRLEDVVAVTDTGVRILSDFVPRSVEAVQTEVAKPGLLPSAAQGR
jgi:Xaa-Pro aminopeptidase